MPMLILAMACLFGHGAASPRGVLDRNRVVLNASLAALVAAVLTQLAPRLLIEWKGYR